MIEKIMKISKDTPHIVTLPAPIKVIGVSLRTNERSIFKDAQILGKQYQKLKQANTIDHKAEPWGFAAISKSFHPDGSWEYLLGDVVTSFDRIPNGLEHFEIPAKLYAKFSFSPRSVLFWGPAMGCMKQFIYAEWLPNSQYTADADVIGDFEYHDSRSKSKKPEIDIYVSIKEKS